MERAQSIASCMNDSVVFGVIFVYVFLFFFFFKHVKREGGGVHVFHFLIIVVGSYQGE